MTVSTITVMSVPPLAKVAFRTKSIPETRPVTATLECPTILDITFLKKLDMTSFTKKGLIAISRICGISLVKRSDDKKIRKRLKRQAVEQVKKEARKRSLHTESSDEQINANTSKAKGRIRGVPKIKVSDVSVSKTNTDSVKTISPRMRRNDMKPSVSDILYGHVEIVVAEPCKTCGRPEQPERFHSHPKHSSGRKQPERKKVMSPLNGPKTEKLAGLMEKVSSPKLAVTSKTTVRRHSTGHLQSESSSRLAVADLESSFHSDHEIESIKMSLPKLADAFSSTNVKHGKPKVKTRNKSQEMKSTLERTPKSVRSQESVSPTRAIKVLTPPNETPQQPSQEDLKYVTGCYVCGEQMSPELRFAHEEQCIAEWRKANSNLPPDKRKAEPLRPDFRFTATGDVDFKGTFNSIWANHVDSLVPCGKCKRTFFPERIEKHEACCNGQSMKQKNSTLKNK